MAIYKINSKKHGEVTALVDDDTLQWINQLGGKWCANKIRGKFYFQKRVGNELLAMHREIMKAEPGTYVDHISGDTCDNRRSNLRICTNAANLRNGSLRVNNKSGQRGVYWDVPRNKWQAKIKVNYKCIFLGRFKKFEDAVEARKKAEVKYWDI